MANPVVNQSLCTCSFGTVPMALQVSSQQTVKSVKALNATVMDFACTTFGMCSSLANPSVASATSAALGVLTPMPCTPVTVSPWTPGCSTVMVNKQMLLNDSSTLQCAYGGVIKVSMTPAKTVKTP